MISELLQKLRCSKASALISDVHITQNEKPWVRINGKMQICDQLLEVDGDVIKEFYENSLNAAKAQILERDHYVTLGMSEPEFGDVRVHIMQAMNRLEVIIRLLAVKVRDLDTLGLPPVVSSFADFPNGLVLFTGATGSGKTTTLAALVNEINKKYDRTIYTLEDPIEYRHSSIRSMVKQFNVGDDIDDYADGLRSFLRGDPDVILLGEMRDPETMAAAIQAAETGHLVFSTLHDNGVLDTCQRIISSFSGDRQAQIKLSFSSAMRAIVSMRLMPGIHGDERVGAYEVLLSNPAVRQQLEKADFKQLIHTMSSSTKDGMMILEADLARLVRENRIGRPVAMSNANNPKNLEAILQGAAA